jgi:hypothetical protein
MVVYPQNVKEVFEIFHAEAQSCNVAPLRLCENRKILSV